MARSRVLALATSGLLAAGALAGPATSSAAAHARHHGVMQLRRTQGSHRGAARHELRFRAHIALIQDVAR